MIFATILAMMRLALFLAALMLAGCALIGQPPVSALAICDGKPVPKGCQR